MKSGYDPQAFIARLAEIVCHDNLTEMHAFKHHQSIVGEHNSTCERDARRTSSAAPRTPRRPSARTSRCPKSTFNSSTPRNGG